MELLNFVMNSKDENFEKAIKLYNQEQYVNALAYFFRALNAAEILLDKQAEAEAKKWITFCYSLVRDYDQVLVYSDDLLENYELESEQRELALTTKACALTCKGQFKSAEKLLKDLLFSESQRVLFRAHTDLGMMYYFMQSFSESEKTDLAFENLKAAYQYAQNLGDKALYKAASNMGLIYLEKGEVAEALKYFEESLNLTENEYEKVQTYNELGRVYAKMGALDKSEDYFEKAARYALENSKFLTLTYNIYYRGLVQIDLGKVSSAYNYLHTALYSFLEHKHYPEVVAIYKELSALFKESHPERAEYFLNEYQYYLNYIDPLAEE